MRQRAMTVEMREVGGIRPYKGNPRQNDAAVGAVARSIKEFGFRQPIVVNARGVIVCGHTRYKAALALGLKKVPVHVATDLSAAQVKAFRIADNKTAERALWDLDLLPIELAELAGMEVDLEGLGFSSDELAELLNTGTGTGLTDPDAAPDPPETPITQPGDLWMLGDHRLLCGDATKPKDVERLLAGAMPGLMVTDPPYGVEYDPAWRNRAAEEGKLAYAARRIGNVANDDRADWREAWELFPGDVLYSWHPAGATSLIHAAAIQAAGFRLRMQIIWAKSNFPIGRGDYHVRHEPCWYAVRKGKVSGRTSDRTQTTLWNITLDKNVEGGHSTQKPVECMARPIRNHGHPEVYDPFLGSGTTVIAAEMLGRRCYGLEIEPRYCDVIVRRWEEFTGRKAKRPAPGKAKRRRRGQG